MNKLLELKQSRDRVLTEARTAIGQIDSNTPDARAKELEAQHDAAMARYNDLTKEIEAAESREGRPVTGGSLVDENGNYALLPEQRMSDMPRFRATQSGARDVSLGGYLASMVRGARTDAERRALSEGVNADGGYTVPIALAANLIDLLRAQSTVIASGARTLPLTSSSDSIAAIASDPTVAWRAESAAISESAPTFSKITFAPKSLAVLVKLSRELAADSVNLNSALPAVVAAAMGSELDRAALLGSGSDNEPTGLANTSGISTIALGGALTDYAPFVNARGKIRGANVDEVSSFIMSIRDETALALLVDSQKQPLRLPVAIQNIPFRATSKIPTNGGSGTNESTIYAGAFRFAVVGIREGITVKLLSERFADTGELALVAHARMDFQLEHPAAFCTVTGIVPAS